MGRVFATRLQNRADGRIFAVTGTGGAEKTQICLEFAEEFLERTDRRYVRSAYRTAA